MYQFKMILNSIEGVKNFVELSSRCSCEIDVSSGRYLVDAKSIMALFSIDLSRPVTVIFHGSAEEAETFYQAAEKQLSISKVEK